MQKAIPTSASQRKLHRRHDEDDSTWQAILKFQEEAARWAISRSQQRPPLRVVKAQQQRGAA
jgi:hypothetical protein